MTYYYRNNNYKGFSSGLRIFLMTKSYYKQMVHDHLHDTDTYEVLSEDLDHDNIVMEKLKEFAEKYDEILSPKEVKYVSDYNTANFYSLPKIHECKQLQDLIESKPSEYIEMADPPKIPGRPVCAEPISPTHLLSNLLDIILTPLTYKVKSYVKDDFNFLHQLPKQIDLDSTFITFDVKSLYTSIPHDLGTEAVSYWVNRFPDYLIDWRFDVDFIVDGLHIILENNIFKFDDVFYRQLTGTAMGTKVAVINAILCMGC